MMAIPHVKKSRVSVWLKDISIYTFVPETPGSYIFLFFPVFTHSLTVLHSIMKTASVVILGRG